MRVLLIFSILVLLNGCAVPNIVMEITNEVVAGNLAEIQKEREKKQAIIHEKQQVIDVVHHYVDTINVTNSQLLANLAKRHATSYSIVARKNNAFTLEENTHKYYLDVNRKKRSLINAEDQTPIFLFHNQMAVVLAPYDFYIKEKLSHCGINAFDLIKEKEEWVVINASWSVQKHDCESLSLQDMYLQPIQ